MFMCVLVLGMAASLELLQRIVSRLDHLFVADQNINRSCYSFLRATDGPLIPADKESYGNPSFALNTSVLAVLSRLILVDSAEAAAEYRGMLLSKGRNVPTIICRDTGKIIYADGALKPQGTRPDAV